MAYSLGERFPPPPQYYRILDPGAYQNVTGYITPVNKVPFLSNTIRRPQIGNKLWTHAIYNNSTPAKIVNCTALKSKLPRFPYEAMTKEDFERLLCQCGIQSICECPTGEDVQEEEIIECQGKVHRRIFKGPTPRSTTPGELLPSVKTKETKIEPPFYNTRVIESTSYYRGCKWSHRSSKRTNDIISSSPGPGHYTLEKESRYETFCAEKVRAYKRRTSKQLRFIEMVQQHNLREKLPGPGSYDPTEIKGTNLSYLGPKAERFSTRKYEVHPGPSDYCVKRDFNRPELPENICVAKLPSPAPFRCKAVRFKPKREEGPSSASYNSKSGTCKFMQCSKAPFGVSSLRFKYFKEIIRERSNEDVNIYEEQKTANESEYENTCILPTWEFRSQSIRMKPLSKKLNEPSPADLPQSIIQISRPYQLQRVAPFYASDERFRPWYNWIPMHNSENTPGPCYYSLEKPRCLPAVHQGPITRSPRFRHINSQTPSPNKYQVGGGIEDVLATHNERLKRNKEKQHTFCWKASKVNQDLSFAEKENLLLNQSIMLLTPNL